MITGRAGKFLGNSFLGEAITLAILSKSVSFWSHYEFLHDFLASNRGYSTLLRVTRQKAQIHGNQSLIIHTAAGSMISEPEKVTQHDHQLAVPSTA